MKVERTIVIKENEISEEVGQYENCLLYTSDAADEQRGEDLGGHRIVKKKKKEK